MQDKIGDWMYGKNRGTDHSNRIFGDHAEILHRLRHERHRIQGAAGCTGRIKTGTAANPLRYA